MRKEKNMEYRKAYRTNDLNRFKKDTFTYLECRSPNKSMGELCDFLEITRFTLSKYKKRGGEWAKYIIALKIAISTLRKLKINSVYDVDNFKLEDLEITEEQIAEWETLEDEPENEYEVIY